MDTRSLDYGSCKDTTPVRENDLEQRKLTLATGVCTGVILLTIWLAGKEGRESNMETKPGCRVWSLETGQENRNLSLLPGG